MYRRIQRETQFEEAISPCRFRTTVLTDLYETTKDIKLAQMSAGHTTAAMTLKHYVKGRNEEKKHCLAGGNSLRTDRFLTAEKRRKPRIIKALRAQKARKN